MKQLTVVIPTYNRGSVLLDTISYLVKQIEPADEIIIVDQTHYEPGSDIANQLSELHEEQVIKWVKRSEPSIPKAMNHGLRLAKTEYVLFLDDDVSFSNDFIKQHKETIRAHNYFAHVGQIIQPWQQQIEYAGHPSKDGFLKDVEFPFNSGSFNEIHNCMAGNLCVNKQQAFDVGGFDEQFSGVAYRFETEFCLRMIKHTGQAFLFSPLATLNHLKVVEGGTRGHAKSHLTSASGAHSEGDYYFALLQLSSAHRGLAIRYILKRLFASVIAKFYLTRPWWIPVRMMAEFLGLFSAIKKINSGPRYIE